MANHYNNIEELNNIVNERKLKRLLIVCSNSFDKLPIKSFVDYLMVEKVYFKEFSPNPKYEEIIEGIKVFRDNKCDSILAIGGGSSIDVAKCIKLFNKNDLTKRCFEEEYKPNKIPFGVIPTTAGSGSEETHFAVIYYDGEKKSIHDQSILPEYVFLLPKVLETLPEYQRKATLLDALSQAIESYWSVNSNDESKEYSKKSINLIMDNYEEYLKDNTSFSRRNMMQASNYAGRAINITKTTAPHAMSYKLTSLYHIAHGEAVFLTLPYVFEHMVNNINETIDKRGKKYVLNVFKSLAAIFNCQTTEETIDLLKELYKSFCFKEIDASNEDISLLVKSVNIERLSNNPVLLNEDSLRTIYQKSLHL